MLPKYSYNNFDITIPSTKETVTFRPYLTKEEKILLTAAQSGLRKDVITAIKQVIEQCVVSGDLVVNELTSFDIEYVYVKLRARSVNNIIKNQYQDGEDNEIYDVDIDLDKVYVDIPEDVKSVISVGDQFKIHLKYLNADQKEQVIAIESDAEKSYFIARNSIKDVILADGTVLMTEDYTDKELIEFIDNLPPEPTTLITKFFGNQPALKYKTTYKNKYGIVVPVELVGLDDFFTLV